MREDQLMRKKSDDEMRSVDERRSVDEKKSVDEMRSVDEKADEININPELLGDICPVICGDWEKNILRTLVILFR